MKKLKKADLLSGSALRTTEIEIEELGGKITLKALSTGQVQRMQKSIKEAQKLKDEDDTAAFRVVLDVVVQGAIDPDTGERMFEDADIEALLEKLPLSVLNKIMKEIIRHSKLDNKEAKEHQEEVEKNSETTQNTDSASA